MTIHAFYKDNQYCSYTRLPTIIANVRRYVQLAQSRGGACFCTRGAMQDYDVVCLFSRWQKP
jgi:hypothetical protein